MTWQGVAFAAILLSPLELGIAFIVFRGYGIRIDVRRDHDDDDPPRR